MKSSLLNWRWLLRFWDNRRNTPKKLTQQRRRKKPGMRLLLEGLEQRVVPNAAPIAYDDYTSTLHDQAVVSSPYFYDPDLDDVFVIDYGTPANGSVTFDGPNSLTYTPATGFTGSDSFTYTVSDSVDETTGTIYIDVTNQAPEAYDEYTSTLHDQAVEIWPYFYDPDNDAVSIIDFSTPANGSVTFDSQTNSLTYTPGTGFVGSDSFTYTVSDTVAQTIATVFIDVTDEAPEFDDADDPDTYEFDVDENSADGTFVGTAAATDPDNDPLTYTITAGNTAGVFAINANTGAITVANGSLLNFETTDGYTLTVQVSDGALTDTATVTISVNDVFEPTVSIIANDPAAEERGADPGMFTVTRTGPTTNALTVHYTVGPATGGATNGTDYNQLNGTVEIAAGSSSATIVVTPMDDNTAEPSEDVTLTISAVNGYIVGTLSFATVTIADNEPEVTLQATVPNTTEGGAPGQFTISRTGSTAAALVVNFTIAGGATNGTDYTNINANVTIPANASSANVNIAAIQDNLVDPDEAVTLTLANNAAYHVGTVNPVAVNIVDVSPTVSIVAIDSGAQENPAENGQFRISRTGSTANNLVVNYTITGSATNNVDYQQLTGTATIMAGQTAVTIDIVPINDTTAEGEETVTLTLSNNNAYIVGTPNHDAVTIYDDEPVARIRATTATAREQGPVNGVFTIELTAPAPAGGLNVTYAVAGTATNGTDYTMLNGTATIIAGQTNVTVTVTPVDDAVGEATETVILTLSNSLNYLIWAPEGSATVNIEDNDNHPTVTVQATTANASEQGPTNGVFTFTRVGGDQTQPLTINYAVAGSATNTTDYGNLNGTVTILANQPTVTLNVVPVDDVAPEPTETVVLTISDSANYAVGTANNATVNIADNENTIYITTVTATTAENGSSPVGRFRVHRTGDTTNNLVVNLTIAGSATNGTDYTNIPNTVTILAGQSMVDIDVTPTDDGTVEPTETVNITVNNSGGFTAVAPTSATVTITDVEPIIVAFPHLPNPGGPPTRLQSNASEPNSTAEFFVGAFNLTGPLNVNFTMTGTATRGVDYTLRYLGGLAIPGNTITLSPANNSFVRIEVVPVDDSTPEPMETVIFTVTNSTSYYIGASTTTVLLFDDDTPADNTPRVSIVASDPIATEGGDDPGGFTVTRTGDTSNALTVNYTITGTASNGVDYTALTGTVQIPANQASAPITITPTNDTLPEGNESVTLTLVAGTNYVVEPANNAATVTIIDNKPVVTVTATDNTATEQGQTTGTFRIARTGSTSAALTVTYSLTGGAVPGLDYQTLTGSVQIPANSSFVDITITPVDDIIDENDETVVLTISGSADYSVGNTAGNATITIADNDGPPAGAGSTVSVTATTPAAAEQGPVAGVFTLTRTNPNANPLTVFYSLSGSATNGLDFTALTGSIVIPANQPTVTVTITPVDDNLGEGDETVILTIAPNNNYLVSGTDPSATVTITDNEPEVSVAATDALATESPGNTGQFTFSRTGATTNALTVGYTISGTATNGVDYTSISGSVTIPATQASATVTITPINDTVYDPSETVIVTITSVTAYKIGTPAATVQIADNEVRLKSVQFGGAGNFTIRHDVTNAPYNGNHWLDSNGDGDVADAGDHSYPVGYASGSTMSIAVTFAKDPLATFVTPQIRGNAAGFAIAAKPPDTITATELSINLTAVNNAFAANTIRGYDPLTFTWEVSDNGTWLPGQTSSNPVYVTLAAPVAGTVLRHTVVRLSTLNADGVTGAGVAGQDAAIERIWTEFTDRQVMRVDQPVQLSYYGNSFTLNFTTEHLLTYGVAQCTSFSELFLDMLKAHGIQQANWKIEIKSSNAMEDLLVNNWTFNGNGYDPNATHPYLNIMHPLGPRTATGYIFTYAQVTEGGGIPGSGNPNPAANFDNHWVARITVGGAVRYFDASYGVNYSSLSELSTVAIAGFYTEQMLAVNEAIVAMDLNGDGDQTDTAVTVAVWQIRKKNPFDSNDLQINSSENY
jgi:hypothetical protein